MPLCESRVQLLSAGRTHVSVGPHLPLCRGRESVPYTMTLHKRLCQWWVVGRKGGKEAKGGPKGLGRRSAFHAACPASGQQLCEIITQHAAQHFVGDLLSSDVIGVIFNRVLQLANLSLAHLRHIGQSAGQLASDPQR